MTDTSDYSYAEHIQWLLRGEVPVRHRIQSMAGDNGYSSYINAATYQGVGLGMALAQQTMDAWLEGSRNVAIGHQAMLGLQSSTGNLLSRSPLDDANTLSIRNTAFGQSPGQVPGSFTSSTISNQEFTMAAKAARITEIPPNQYAPLFGKGGMRDTWYKDITSTDRADRSKVEAAFAVAYTNLFNLPVPQFWWLDSPGDDKVDLNQTGGLVEVTKMFDGILDLCLKPFHGVLASHYGEIISKDETSRNGKRMEEATEVFNRVFTGNDDQATPPVSALASPVFIKVKGMIQVFVEEHPEQFPDLKLTPERRQELLQFIDAIKSVYAFYPSKSVCTFFERPAKVTREETPRGMQLHREDGPAIEFADGKGRYVLDGIVVPEHVVMRPDTITLREIETNDNIEVRRLMIGQRGVGWYLGETKATILHVDSVKVFDPKSTVDPDDRELSMPRALIKDKDGRIYLCGTDGSTDRVYYMMCPGNVSTCAEAHTALSGGLDESKCVAQS